MFDYSENTEEFDSYNPMVNLYRACKFKNSNNTSWLNTPKQDDDNVPNFDHWSTPPIYEREMDKRGGDYLSSFFLDYHHEIQIQQMKLQQRLKQLQLLEHLIQPTGNSSGNTTVTTTPARVLAPTLGVAQNCNTLADCTPPPTATIKAESEIIPPASTIISTNDFSQWISEDDSPSMSLYLDNIPPLGDYERASSNHTNNISSLPVTSPVKSPLETDRRASVSTASSTSISAPHRYTCNDCGKGFARASSLRTHRNIHTGDRPFICPYKNCGKSFNARSNMLRHHKLHFKTDCGLYRLPNGETTSVKPSSRKLFALSKQQHQRFTAFPTV